MKTGKAKSQGRNACCSGLRFLLVAVALAVNAAEPLSLKPVSHATLQAASEAAAADQSMVLVIFSAQWCGPCKLLRKNTLDSPEFLDQGGALHLTDVDIDANTKAARDFAVEVVPTLVLMTADNKIVARTTGYMDTAELLLWIKEGRRRSAAGQWEGTVTGAKLDEFISKANSDNLTTNDLQLLIAMLGESNPSDRASAAKILLAQREQSVTPLIAALGDPYLGMRISASELLQQLAPDSAAVDPWQSPAELADAITALKKWWADTGKLPQRTASGPLNSSAEASIKEALNTLRGGDPARRTDAMSALVGQGAEGLPAIRDAIKLSERTGDQRSLLLLEDVRWAILIPDAIEQRAGGMRAALARGKSPDRQSAATRLSRIGRDALPALTELINDSDSPVAESAVRALSGIGGKDAVPAMAALLNAGDSNLRLTAAQALGHTKNSDAVKPLLTVFDDPNEVVACAALAALEEIRSAAGDNSSKKLLAVDVSSALRHCLSDSRWRVRAATAEIIGKVEATEFVPDLKKLLEDTDGFVVKSALLALGQLHATPESEQLAALGKRLPSLRGDTVGLMLQSDTDETAKEVTELFNSSKPDEQAAILRAFAKREISNEGKSDEAWKPLLTRATTAADPKVRRIATESLGGRALALAAELIGPLLADEDRETRIAAASVLVGLLAKETNAPASSTKTNKALFTTQQKSTWHSALLQHTESAADLMTAAAVFATGDGKSDLPLLLGASVSESVDAAGRRNETAAIALMIYRLPWPEGQPLVDKFCQSPRLFAMAARASGRAVPVAADYLLEPSRFKSAVERANGQELSDALELLAGYDYERNRGWSLWSETDRTKAVALALVESTNAAWRAAAVFSLGLRLDAAQSSAVFERALADSNAWVRAAAVQATARCTKDRAMLETRLGPLVSDADFNVAETAARALLEPEVRQTANLEQDYFQYENERGGRSESSGTSDERPLTTLEGKPAFLQPAKDHLASTNAEAASTFALLLAQYGEFDGVDRLADQPAGSDSGNQVLLTAIALSRDPKYLPTLRRIMEGTKNEWDLRKILQALKGMTGPEARQLRLEINKRLRDRAGSAAVID
jgi:HEAT repeat protein